MVAVGEKFKSGQTQTQKTVKRSASKKRYTKKRMRCVWFGLVRLVIHLMGFLKVLTNTACVH
jgi:hypothetical protein